MSRVLAIGDLHEPFTHPKYLAFCKDVKRMYRTKETVFIGDQVDLHAMSFHQHDVDGMSAGHEKVVAKKQIATWYKAFPNAKVCIGNHDARTIRLAAKVGMPVDDLKDFKTSWGTPNWDWQWEHEIDGVLYLHGTGASGKQAAANLMMKRRRSVVIGHTHTNAGINYHTNHDNRIFGMNVGCGIDCNSYAFAYAKDFADRPVLGCGVVIDGIGHFIPMPCGPGEKFAR
jgi:predicted phosphodiesterase